MRLHAEDAALVGEEQQLVVGVAGDHAGRRFGILRRAGPVVALGDALDALPATALRAEGVDGLALDVAVASERDDRGLMGHEVRLAELFDAARDDLGHAIRAVSLDQLVEVLGDHAVDLLGVGEQRFEIFDGLGEVLVLLFELGALKGGEAAELHVEHGLGLALGEVEGVLLEAVAGSVGGFGGADRGDDRVDHVDRLEQPRDDVVAVAGLFKVEFRATANDLAPVVNERGDQLEQREGARASAGQGDEVGVVADLQVGGAVEVREHGSDIGVASELDHQPHAVSVGLVAQVADAVDPLVAYVLGDLLDDPHLVGLVGDFGEDDLDAAAGGLFDVLLAAQREAAAAGRVGLLQVFVVFPCEEQSRAGEVRTLQHSHQVADRGVRAFEHHFDGGGDLAEVVRRHRAGHRDGDAGGAVDQQIGQPRGQYDRFVQRFVEVGCEIDRVFVEVGEHLLAGGAEARLCVTHRGGRIVIDGAVVALPVDQRHAHVPGLRHPHHRLVDGHIGVRVILAEHLADDPGALAVGLIGTHAEVVHRVQNAPLDRLEAVADIGQRAGDDHAHRIVEIGRLHLVDELLRADIVRCRVGRFGYHIALQISLTFSLREPPTPRLYQIQITLSDHAAQR